MAPIPLGPVSLRRVAAVVVLTTAVGVGTPPAGTQLCVLSQGYWKTHPAEWPVATLVLGSPSNPAHTYGKSALLAILDTNVKNDASLTLAFQLIAAKLNLANGSEPAPIQTELARADALFGAFPGKLPYKVQQNTPSGRNMVALAKTLEDYNLGRIAGSCPVINTPPVANAGGPYSGVAGQPVAFDGNGSRDPDGDALTFAWTFGDGGSATGATPFHTFGSPGQFTVALTVSDGKGGTHTASTVATIAPPPPANRDPVAVANGPYAGSPGEPIQFSSAGSSDPDNDPLAFAWDFGDGGTSSDANPQHTYAAAGPFTATLTVNDGRGGTATATAAVTVTTQPPANRDPVAVANGPYTGTAGEPIQFSSAGSSDPDNDPLAFAWDFGDGGKSLDPNPQHTYAAGSPFTATLTVSDGRGGTASASAAVTVTTQVTLQSLAVDPPALRFADLNATATLAVTGHYSDGTTRNLTNSAAGTTYLSAAPQVASVDAAGLVTALANGSTEITVANGGVSKQVPVAVEEGVALQALELLPPIVTLRALGATASATLRGSFSDGSIRDLTSDPGATLTVVDGAIASVSASGLVTALAPGLTTLTGRFGGLTATAEIRVLLTESTSFLRGEVFDDTRGQPLAGATATVLAAGGVVLTAPTPVAADERGRFVLPAAPGAAIIRVERSGFTSVEREATTTGNGVSTLLDARLTPLDGRINVLQSVFGGEAASSDGTAHVSVPSGSLDADVTLRVTPMSNQGLQGVLPPGWSPIAAVDLQPAGRRFTQTATLRLPHADTLAAGVAVALVRYDSSLHRWVATAPGQVSSDRRTLQAGIETTGQYAFVVPDEAPFTPPPAAPGEMLAGLSPTSIPSTAKAAGEVVPRSAPPGDNARAVGMVILQPPQPLPSGVVVRARVTEQFDLLDASRVVPLQFVQDLVLYARPRLGDAGTLATRLPITPSLQFNIQQLSLGTVRLDVTVDEPTAIGAIVGDGGGSLTDAAGNVLEIPAGALSGDLAIGLLPLTTAQVSAPIPAGFTLLGAVLIDLVGASFAQPSLLSIPRPSGLDGSAQVIVAQVISDATGGRRLKIVGLGAIGASRITVQTTIPSLTFEGVRTGGEYVFLQPAQALGFVNGLVSVAGGTFQPLALVTTNTAPFAFLTTATGAFVVAGQAGVPTVVAAVEPAGASASGNVALAAVNDVAPLNLLLTQTAPAVTATTPAANAANVPLDTSILVDFSKPIDPATVTTSSVVLRAGATPVDAQLVLSANRRRLTITPAAPLAGVTLHSLTLTSDVRDQTGVALSPFAPLAFTTLDPSKATVLALGVITAELPDEDGFTLISGAPGAAEPMSAVVATNLRTQETVTVLASADGSFRLRVNVIVGDEVVITLRGADGRETTIAITQFSASDGSTAIGTAGGTIQGAAGRVGRILPRALSDAGVFQLTESNAAALPTLPASTAAVDRFALTIAGASFRALDSLTLTESQGRFAPASALSAPFGASAELTVPADFLVTASLRFTAAVADRDGTRRSATGTTVVVAGGPDTTATETGFGDQFPTVFVTAPKQAIPAQVVGVLAIAPAARVDLDLPTSFDPPVDDTVLLTRLVAVGAETKLSLIDRLTRVEVSGTPRLRTVGRDLPGLSRAGEHAIVSGPFAFVTGRANGPAAIVTVDGSPFVFETGGANGAFTLPVVAEAPFTLRFLEAATGAVLGTTSGQAPQAGATANLGLPLAPAGGTLTVSAQPDSQSVVDIATPIVFRFSEALDPATVTPGAFVVTDAAGARVFGRVALSDDARTVMFDPLRRWKFGASYRYGVTTSVASASGAVLQRSFTGEFTTFAPRVLGSVALDDARDVGLSGNLAIVATNSGATVLDLTRPDAPTAVASVPLAGGAGGVAIVTTPLSDRNGVTTGAPLAVVASGEASTAGIVQTFSVDASAALSLLGTTQVSTAVGQTAPPGVPELPGVPSAIVVDVTGRALVSVQDVGLSSVALGLAIPDDPSNLGAALGPRYPASGAGDAVQAVLVGEHVVVAGAAGLTTLNAASLTKTGEMMTGELLGSVAALPDFGFDIDGDGATDRANEVFDLVIAGDAAGFLQLVRITAGVPELISVVRMPGLSAIGGVAVSADEGLAYVGAGARGFVIVDLRGPASIQPIDQDRDGVDDRVLGLVDTPGIAGRSALDLARGLAHVADRGGLVTIQVVPPRVRVLTLQRDPILLHAGDEETLSAAIAGFVSDQAVRATVESTIPFGGGVSLAIEEVGATSRALSFDDGRTVRELASGRNDLVLRIARGASPAEAALVARDSSGRTLARRPFRLIEPPTDPEFQSIFVEPPVLQLDAETASGELAVGGVLGDRRVLNITDDPRAVYRTTDGHVATVTGDGVVTGIAGGRTRIEITRGPLRATTSVVVDLPATLTGLQPGGSHLTLLSTVPQPLGFTAHFSDGTTRAASELADTSFSTSAPAVVTVDADGRATALADGTAVIMARNGSFEASVQVDVELRGATSIDAIALMPFATAASTDSGRVAATARLLGSGALHGFVVTFSSNGAVSRAVSNGDGVASGTLSGFTVAGQFAVTASVIDPATGLARTDEEPVVVQPGTSDAEPNDTDSSASPLGSGLSVSGQLAPGSDLRDVFHVASSVDATLTLSLHIVSGTASDLTIVIRDASGQELSRTTPTGVETELSITIPGAAFVSLELAGQAVQYRLSSALEQTPPTIATVVPATAPPGTTVIISGTGFSRLSNENAVFFAGVRAKLISSSTTRLEVVVPVNAVDGAVSVSSGGRGVTGPQFVVGRATPLQLSFSEPSNPANRRHDPISGAVIDVSRLSVYLDPSRSRTEAEQIAALHGGRIVGFLRTLNRYDVEYAARTLQEHRAIEAALLLLPDVIRVTKIDFPRAQEFTIDSHARAGEADGRSLAEPYLQVALFDAIRSVRNTPQFRNPFSLRTVKVAVIDTGFNPTVATEFPPNTRLIEFAIGGEPVELTTRHDQDGGHGTASAGIIAALNDGSSVSGVLGSLYRISERSFAEARIQLVVYGCGIGPKELSSQCIDRAFEHIITDGDFDVVNTSFTTYDYASAPAASGCPGQGTAYTGAQKRCDYYWLLQPLLGRTLLVSSAGNDGVQSNHSFPAALERDLANVISVGAVAVTNLDGTGEGRDERAVFGAIRTTTHAAEVDCRPVIGLVIESSNCGPGVTLAAPGEEFNTTFATVQGIAVQYNLYNGTSAAAPLVAGAAALLQAIRPTPTIIPPAILRSTLVETADDISATWKTATNEPMVRLNVLGAVRRILPDVTNQRIYVTDHAPDGSSAVVVGLNVDPLTGESSGAAEEIPLLFTHDGQTIKGLRAPAIVVPEPGDQAYVLAATDRAQGDGVFVVSTTDSSVLDFIPLSGPPLGTTSTIPTVPVRLSQKAAMVASRNGRTLFISTGAHIFLVDTPDRRRIDDLKNASWPPSVGRPIPSALLVLREAEVRAAVEAAQGEIVGLALSPDSRTLYAVVQTGVGTGFQPGFMMEIDVALDIDRDPSTPLVELDLSNFFRPRNVLTRFEGSDEPSAAMPSPDGKHVYLTNGGVQSFGAVSPGVTNTDQIRAYLGSFFGDRTGGEELIRELEGRQYTQLLASGKIQAFAVQAGEISSEVWSFSSELSPAWTQTTPVITDQLVRRKVNAERTFAGAFRYDGRRALVPFFQTGNFGVLDLVAQESQPQSAVSPGVFQGLVAVTPSLQLDAYLWPPPEQLPLLYPTGMVYAQNGRFAAAVHTGVNGGAVTVLDDNRISADLVANLDTTISNPDSQSSGDVPFFEVRPLCGSRAAPTASDCLTDVFTTFTEYQITSGSGSVKFGRPRAIAIQPFVNVILPGFGDRVGDASPVHFAWRDGRAAKYEITVVDLGLAGFGNAGAGAPVGDPIEASFTAKERLDQLVKKPFGKLFVGHSPQDNHRYRLEVRVLTGANETVSLDSVEVVYRR
jgi:PKD repeat protein